jgi:hypothetical protein
VPKKPRQAHVPQQTRRKKVRRTPLVTPEDVYLAPAPTAEADALTPRPRPRSAPQPRLVPTRPALARAAGQLPTFERHYLMDELRRIAITGGALLLFVIILAVVFR